MVREFGRGPAAKPELRDRDRRALGRERRQELHLDDQLRFDVGALRESEDPVPVDFECHAVAPLAEMLDTDWIEFGELRPDQSGGKSTINRLIGHSMICPPQVSHRPVAAATRSDRPFNRLPHCGQRGCAADTRRSIRQISQTTRAM